MAFPKRIGCLLNLLFRPSGALRVMLDGPPVPYGTG